MDGYFPGDSKGKEALSQYLLDMNNDMIKEGSYVFAMLSTFDDLIMYQDKVWGKYTSEIVT